MTAPTRVFNSPLWTYDPAPALQAAAAAAGASSARAAAGPAAVAALKPHHPETWKVSVWQVRRAGSMVGGRRTWGECWA